MARGIERRRTVKTAAAAADGGIGAMAPSPTSSASTPVNRANDDGKPAAAAAPAKTANGCNGSNGSDGSTNGHHNAVASEKKTVEAIMADGSPVKVTVNVPSDATCTHQLPEQQQQQQDKEEADAHMEQQESSPTKGKREAAAAATAASSSPSTSKKPPVDSRITSDEDKNLSFTWICTVCREAECLEDSDSPLLVCEGPCLRPFHYPCAGLTTLPPEDEIWVCTDCQQNRHQCAVCNEYGADDEDVFKCERATCGLYFHENCLSMYENVEVDVVERAAEVTELDQDGNEVVSTQIVCRPRFTCPAHSCWTCSGGMPPDPNASMMGAVGEDTADKDGKDDGGTGGAGGKKKGGRSKKGKKKKKKNKIDNAFAEKKEQLFRCLDCPIAYHITCIPPCSRFHELALLCHEHCTNKLPDLDTENSFQAEVEAKADAMIEKMRESKRRKLERLKKQKEKKDDYYESVGFNRFLFGMKGTTISDKKQEIYRLLHDEQEGEPATPAAPNGDKKEDDNGEDAARPVKRLRQIEFCLPCDFQQEVYSKPPLYTHVHGLKYNPTNRPKKHPPSNEVCKCKSCGKDGAVICDDHCLNRMVMTECVGDKSKGSGEKNPYWNCNAGTNCGNRMIGQRKFAKCRPKREQGKGWGLVAVNGVRKGGLVQEYGGEVIDEAEKKVRLDDWALDHPNDPNFYVMSLEPGWYIDARVKGNLARFINHSCGPNCHLVPTNVSGNMRVAVVALRDIAPGEFLSYDYQFDTRHGDKFVCRCGAANCRGSMKGGRVEGKGAVEVKKTKKQMWAEAKARYDRDKKFLEELAADQVKRLNQVGFLVPGEIESKDSSSLVASGPQEKDRDYAQVNRIFLWRNVYPGSDFSSRYWKHKGSKKRKREVIPGDSAPSLPVLDVLSLLKE
mmetsp:Transcript_25088/g.54715  ORF Transcript_25088/g.54715 Transcript_25088/m.54715 type:complete len:901 (-) Transcript_25088:104-2806(-)|eukprot:CAMPEP_0178511844 /NCGR_PEP_ID=MMETSP0696-20121128/22579_1 /TAXON_ID=265572 /ORGANISM="Extubocellulus spinifer, Strain CCMP396" /LENGTH=900 /DNA_ID=CAMNT_0020141645 /DNA_START=149 /DNA_END=2851 /DNA_ORIENTATION=-